ncbi:MAG: DNA polymerase domain-containing protein [Clostridia bacterium]
MEFKLTKIDPYNCSLKELETEIKRLKFIKEEYDNLQNSIKIYLNSIYGGMASPWFECYNISIAEAVTVQGQDIIKYTNEILDDYFLNMWHKDKVLHEKLGLTYVNQIKEQSLIIYNDTDSTFFTFGPVIQSCDTKLTPIEFILKIKELKLTDYLNKKFSEYAKKFNTKNLQDLELEKISHSAIMVAKKKYILDLAWKDPGVNFKPQEKIKFVGIELVQGSTSKFARKALKELIRMALDKQKGLQYADVVKRMKEYKKDFALQNPDDIGITKGIGDYEKYVLEDKKQIKLAEKCPINIRSSAIYNHLVMNSKWKSKYSLLKTGDKVKYYYAKDGIDNVFGFLPNNFPYEFGPAVDYDLQFETTIVNPFNRILETMGFNSVPGNLLYARPLF